MFQPKTVPKTLSYSSWSLKESDTEEFFLRYLACNRPSRLPQTNYMSVGSGFDAFVKAELHTAIFGDAGEFAFDKLFTSQVEEQNRDFAYDAGKHALEAYRFSGAYDELLGLLERSVEPPRFESTLTGEIGNGVPFTGKPDLRFMLPDGVRVVLDWKVRGYCSKSATSPSPGFSMCRDAYVEGKPTRGGGKAHAKYLAYDHRGLEINAGYMETCSKDYANQVSIYGWLLGETPGDEQVVVAIDEIVSKGGAPETPLLRVAQHKARVSRDHQLELLKSIEACWESITSGHIFTYLSEAESDEKCEEMERLATGLASNGTPSEDWFNEVVRSQFKF